MIKRYRWTLRAEPKDPNSKFGRGLAEAFNEHHESFFFKRSAERALHFYGYHSYKALIFSVIRIKED